jgi:hypothetical protein
MKRASDSERRMSLKALKELGVVDELTSRPKVSDLEKKLADWANADIFFASKDATVAKTLAEITLCHTYLFGRFTLPSYAGHVFTTLRDLPPLDEEGGRILRSNAGVFRGELLTNNIYGRPGECHSHYVDMKEAAVRAGVDPQVINDFEEKERKYGFDAAIRKSSLWSKDMVDYALKLKELTKDPFTTFTIAVASEDTIQQGYTTILKYLNADGKFDEFRHFMKRHIELDRSEHGPATIRWLNYFVRKCKPDASAIDKAIDQTVDFVDRRIATYKF